MEREGSILDFQEWVRQLGGTTAERDAAWSALLEAGVAARHAVREGLANANWQVRRWCAVWLDETSCRKDQPNISYQLCPEAHKKARKLVIM